MTHTQVLSQRPDVDVREDIERLMLTYPPLTKDRHSVRIEVTDGVAKVSGHVQTPNTRRYFLDSIPGVEGVESVDAAELYEDESIRIEVGRLLPLGVNVGRCQYGNVVLVGSLPDDVDGAKLVADVRGVPGVRRVITQWQ